MSQPIRGQGGHLVFPIGPNNTNLVEGIKILLPVKFCWIPFSNFREEVENVSANQRPGRPSCFSDRPKKNTNLVEGVAILLLVKFRWIPFSRFRGEVENVSANQRPGRPSCFSDRPEKKKLGRGRWDLAFCQVSLNSVQRFQRRSRKCESLRRTTDGRIDDGRCAMTIAHSSLRLRWATYCAPEYNVPPFWRIGQCGHLVFPIGPKNTNLVEDVEILLPVKFCWILFSGFRGEVENGSTNQRPGRPSCFSDRPEKHKLGRGRWDLASCQVSLNSVQRFQRRSRKCVNQSEARAAILFFRSARKTQTW